jgi:hypothetical protein
MIYGRTECALALIVLFCVLLIFLFPVVLGPYPAVHGPVTALFSLRTASRLRMGIILAGLSAGSEHIPCPRLSSRPVTSIDFSFSRFERSGLSPACASILRC